MDCRVQDHRGSSGINLLLEANTVWGVRTNQKTMKCPTLGPLYHFSQEGNKLKPKNNGATLAGNISKIAISVGL